MIAVPPIAEQTDAIEDRIDELRVEAERDLGAVMRRFNERQRGEVMRAINRYGSVSAVPDAFWRRLARELEEDIAASAAILLLLSRVYAGERLALHAAGVRLGRLSGDLYLDEELPRDRDAFPLETPEALRRLTRVEQDSSAAASAITRETAGGYVDRAREAMRRKIDERAADINELPPVEARGIVQGIVDDEFGEGRAVRESVGLTTDTITVGQRSAADDFRDGRRGGTAPDGAVRTRLVWVTEDDDIVCEICAPLNDQPEELWQRITRDNGHPPEVVAAVATGPRAHHHCRCRMRIQVDWGDGRWTDIGPTPARAA